MNKEDHELIKWLKIFNKYDLYTKSDNIVVTDEIKSYHNLINKYLNNGILYF